MPNRAGYAYEPKLDGFRRELLESLNLAGLHWCTAPSFEDGHALWSVVQRDQLEGMVAKPLRST
jgi:ATP-dependent DNA ligase